MLSARSSAVRARLGNDSKVSIDYIEACGDCFYLAMEAALSDSDGWRPLYGVGQQREVVASSMTEEIFQLYSTLHEQRCEGASRSLALPPACPWHPPTSGPGRPSHAATHRHTVTHAGFNFMQGVESLDTLRARVMLRGQKVGAHKCVWADGFAMVRRRHPPSCSPAARANRGAPRRKRLPTTSASCSL
jgi:hypothetical protein